MEAFQERMINEYRELSDRVVKLKDFIDNNPLFDKLDKKERQFQIQQLTGMKVYLGALMGRLDHQGLSDYMTQEATE